MKNLPLLFLTIFLIGLFSGITTEIKAADCTASSIDVEFPVPGVIPPGSTSGYLVFPDPITGNPTPQFLAQSFQPTQSNLTGASIYVPPGFGPGTFTIQLWEGLPMAAIDPFNFPNLDPQFLLAFADAPVPPGGGGFVIADWGVVPVTPGNDYFIRFVSTDIPSGTLGFYLLLGDMYAPGGLFLSPLAPDIGFDTPFQVFYCTNLVFIPTMGQWGLILLALLLVSFGTVQVMRQQLVLSGGNAFANSSFNVPLIGRLPFKGAAYSKALLLAFGLIVVIFGTAITGFGYQWMKADFLGIVLTLPILAYLLHLLSVKE